VSERVVVFVRRRLPAMRRCVQYWLWAQRAWRTPDEDVIRHTCCRHSSLVTRL